MYKIDEYVNIKTCSCGESHFDKLILTCEDKLLNTTETSLDDKKVTCEKSNCLIHTMSFVIICLLLLVVICVSRYFSYTNMDQNKNITIS